MEKCPLTGQPCQHHKHLHITDITTEGVKSFSVCQMCAGSLAGPAKPAPEPQPPQPGQAVQKHGEELLEILQQLILAPLNLGHGEPLVPPTCPGCGTTLNDIARTGRLGCARCYEFYRTEMLNVLKQAHQGKTKHVGKSPKNKGPEPAAKQAPAPLTPMSPEMIRHRIASLEEKMKAMVAAENYEAAALLRDTIKTLQQQLEPPLPPTPPQLPGE